MAEYLPAVDGKSRENEAIRSRLPVSCRIPGGASELLYSTLLCLAIQFFGLETPGP